MHIGNRQLLCRYILSASTILCLLACLIVGVFRVVLLKNLNDFNDLSQQNTMDGASENVCREVKHIQELLLETSLSKELNPVRIKRSIVDTMSVQNELRQRMQLESYISECVLISGDFGFAISDRTSYRFQWFLDTFRNSMLGECTNYQQVSSVLKEHPILSIEAGGRNLIGLSCCYNYGNVTSDSYLMALIPAEDLLDMFMTPVASHEKIEGMFWFGDQLFSTFPEGTEVPGWENLLEQENVSLGNVSYKVMTREYPSYGLRFAYLIDEHIYAAPIVSATHQILFWIILIFLMGTALLVLWVYHNYKPIKSLQTSLETYLKKEPDYRQNELHFIARGIDQLISENIQMGNRLDVDKRQLKNFCLFKLLNGPVTDDGATIRALGEVGIRMDRECFQCISISLKHSEDIDLFARRIEEERLSQCPYLSLYYLINGTSVVLIFNFDQKDIEMIRYLLDNFTDFYVREIDMVMGVGAAVTGIEKLHQSYNQSQMAMRYAETEETVCLSSFENMQLNENIEKLYNSRQVDALLDAIQKDDREAITYEMGQIRQFIRESRMPRYAIKAMYYQIVNGILSNSQNPILFEKGNEILMAIGDTLQKCSLDEVHEQIEAFCYQIVDQSTGVLLLDKILNYITEHYADPDFSIANMAADFHMSHKSMGALFKNEMHLTIIEYITKYKISTAVELLTQTNLPIAEIVRKVGYVDNSSFTRKFKSCMGMTPAEYRRSFSHHTESRNESSAEKF